jgi:hypothetical protein
MISMLMIAVAAMAQGPEIPREMGALKAFQGTWKGDVQITPPGEKAFGGPAMWTITPVVGGLYMQIEVEHDLKAMGVVRGLSLVTWDKTAGKYLSFTFSNNPAEVGKPRAEFVTLTGKKLDYLAAGPGAGLGQTFEIGEDGKMQYKLRLIEGEKEMIIAQGTLKKS